MINDHELSACCRVKCDFYLQNSCSKLLPRCYSLPTSWIKRNYIVYLMASAIKLDAIRPSSGVPSPATPLSRLSADRTAVSCADSPKEFGVALPGTAESSTESPLLVDTESPRCTRAPCGSSDGLARLGVNGAVGFTLCIAVESLSEGGSSLWGWFEP